MNKQETIFLPLGEYLRKKRVAANLSQGEVARHFGYSSSQFVSNFERGLCSPPVDVLRDLIRLYKLPVGEVVDFLVKVQREFFKQALAPKALKSARARKRA